MHLLTSRLLLYGTHDRREANLMQDASRQPKSILSDWLAFHQGTVGTVRDECNSLISSPGRRPVKSSTSTWYYAKATQHDGVASEAMFV